jgi:hypothetical protein
MLRPRKKIGVQTGATTGAATACGRAVRQSAKLGFPGEALRDLGLRTPRTRSGHDRLTAPSTGCR